MEDRVSSILLPVLNVLNKINDIMCMMIIVANIIMPPNLTNLII